MDSGAAIRNTTELLRANLSRADPQPMELWGYSRGSITVGEALNRYKAREIERRATLEPQRAPAAIRAEVEALLRDRVTVLAVGNN